MSLSPEQISKLSGKPLVEQHNAVKARIAECVATCQSHTTTPLPLPVVVYDLKGTTAGQAYGTGLIRLNLDLLHDHWDYMMEQTIPHEVAHIVVEQLWPNSKSHGYQWQLVMAWLGVPAHRTHNMPAKKVRKHARPHIYYCGCVDPATGRAKEWHMTNLMHAKIQSGSGHYCPRCKVRLH